MNPRRRRINRKDRKAKQLAKLICDTTEHLPVIKNHEVYVILVEIGWNGIVYAEAQTSGDRLP